MIAATQRVSGKTRSSRTPVPWLSITTLLWRKYIRAHACKRLDCSVIVAEVHIDVQTIASSEGRVRFLRGAWRPQGITTTIRAERAPGVYSSDDPCGYHAKISRAPASGEGQK